MCTLGVRLLKNWKYLHEKKRTSLSKRNKSLATQIRFKNIDSDSEEIGDLLRDQCEAHIPSHPQPLSLWQSKERIIKSLIKSKNHLAKTLQSTKYKAALLGDKYNGV